MRGTLHGDFSRGPNPGARDERALHLQQGRVLLDADWNAQAAWLNRRLETGVADLLGNSGGPEGQAGFEIEVQPVLDLGGTRFAVIGGAGGLELPVVEVETLGFALELHVSVTDDGAIVRLARLGGDRLWSLDFRAGRLRFEWPGVGGSILESQPVDLGDRIHHVAVTGNAKRTTLYLDGVALASKDFGLLPAAGSILMLVGARYEQGEALDLLAGKIAGMRLWHTHLRAEHIERFAGRRLLVERDVSAVGHALVGDWRFDEGRGREILDHTAHCNHAELHHAEPHDGAPAWVPMAPRIGAGRYYVDGVLCENAASTPFDRQPQLAGLSFPLPDGRARGYIFYLDAWERTVSAAEDPTLRETALGGADTAVRSRAVTQVKVLEIPPQEVDAGQSGACWQGLLASYRRRGRLRVQRQQIGMQQLDNCLYRVEIHDSGFAWQAESMGQVSRAAEAVRPTGRVDADGAIEVVLTAPWTEGWYEGQTVALVPKGDGGDHTAGGVLAIVRRPDPALDHLWLAGDLTSLHKDARFALVPIATCKWSRTNGAIAFGIDRIDPGGRQLWTVASARSLLEVPEDAWLEVLDESTVLAGRRAPLSQIESINAQENSVSLRVPLPAGVRGENRRFLRLWDQQSTNEISLGPTGVLPVTGQWQALESGIEMQVAAGERLTSGDYWWVVSRALGGDEIWPLDQEGEPLWQPSDGVEHRLAPLAMLSYEREGFRLIDLRQIFQPLAAGGHLAGGTVDGSLRVAKALSVDGDATVEGRLKASELLGPVCTIGAVSEHALADGAVTQRALSDEVGTVPDGFGLLAPVAAAAEGFVWHGAELTLAHGTPIWRDRFEIPGGAPGRMTSVTLGGVVYSFLASGEVWAFDMETLAWQRRQPQPSMRRAFAAVRLGKRIYLIGGVDAADRPIGDVLAYEPDRDQWHDCRPIPHARAHAAAAAAGDWIHVFGGLRRALGPDRVTRDHRAYDPDTDAWHARRPLRDACAGAAAANVGGAISVAGGEERWLLGRWGRALIDRHARYLPTSDRWTRPGAALPTPRRDARLVVVYDRLWMVGGRGLHGALADCASWDIASDAWIPGPPLHEAVDSPGVAAVGGTLVVTGAQRAGGQGTLVESCRVATRFRVHEREQGAAGEDGLTKLYAALPASPRSAPSKAFEEVDEPPEDAPGEAWGGE